MTKRTRLFLIIAAGVLAVGLGTGLVASYMGLPALALQGGAGPDELRFVPPDARVVAYANVRDVMMSDLRQRVRQARPESDRQNEFRDRTGIDIENDIDEVVASLGSGAEDAEDALVIARGRFDTVRIEGFIRENGGQVTEYSGVRMLTHTVREGRRQAVRDMALAFVEPGLIAFGSEPAVRAAIDRRSGGQNITTNDEVMGLVRDIDDGNAWAVGRFDALARSARLPEEVANKIPAINWFAASGHVNGGVSGLLRAEARDEAAAQNLRDVVRGFMALAKLQAGSQPEVGTLMESLQLGGQGRTVSLAFSLPTEVIDMLAAAGRRHAAEPDNDRDDRDNDSDDDDPDDHRQFEPPDPPEPPEPPQPPQPRSW